MKKIILTIISVITLLASVVIYWIANTNIGAVDNYVMEKPLSSGVILFSVCGAYILINIFDIILMDFKKLTSRIFATFILLAAQTLIALFLFRVAVVSVIPLWIISAITCFVMCMIKEKNEKTM